MMVQIPEAEINSILGMSTFDGDVDDIGMYNRDLMMCAPCIGIRLYLTGWDRLITNKD